MEPQSLRKTCEQRSPTAATSYSLQLQLAVGRHVLGIGAGSRVAHIYWVVQSRICLSVGESVMR